jgi:flagellar assembly protein FliH
MNSFDPILRDVLLHAEVRRLQRPSSVKPEHRAAKADIAEGAGVRADSIMPTGPAGVPAPAFVPESVAPVAFPLPALEDDIERRVEQARAAGFQQGMREGAAKVQRDMEHRAEQLAQELSEERVRQALVNSERLAKEKTQALQEELAQQRDAYARLLQSASLETARQLKEAEDDVLVLAFAMVCKVLGEQAVTRSGLGLLVDRALQNWHVSSAPLVHLHPDDFSMIQTDAKWRTAFGGSGSGDAGLIPQLVSDPAVTVGGCILRSADGALDARLDAQIEAMKTALVRTRNAQRAGLSGDASLGGRS